MEATQQLESVNRVVSKEMVKTPAGRFECFVIENETKGEGIIDSSTSWKMKSKTEISATGWFASGVGLIRHEMKMDYGLGVSKTETVLREYRVEQ